MSLINYKIKSSKGTIVEVSHLPIESYYFDSEDLCSLVGFGNLCSRSFPKCGVFAYNSDIYKPEILGGMLGGGASLFLIKNVPNLNDRKVSSKLEDILFSEGYSIKERGMRRVYFGNVLGMRNEEIMGIMILMMDIRNLGFDCENCSVEEVIDFQKVGKIIRRNLGEIILNELNLEWEFYKDWLVNRVDVKEGKTIYYKNVIDPLLDDVGLILSHGGFLVASFNSYMPFLYGSKEIPGRLIDDTEKIRVYEIDNSKIEGWNRLRNDLRSNFCGSYFPVFSGINKYLVRF